MREVKAIETVYNGYRFRSRLEARWAVFFDALGVKYEYEPEGFELPSGKRYFPDFRIKCYGTRGEYDPGHPFDLYVEVKGNVTQEDAERIIEFSRIKDEHDRQTKWYQVKKLFIDEFDCFDHDKYEKFYENLDMVLGLGIPVPMNSVLVVGTIPGVNYMRDIETTQYVPMDAIMGIYQWNYELIDGDYFGAYPAVKDGHFYLDGADSSYETADTRMIQAAFDKARQARFEHGENPSAKVQGGEQ